MSSGAAIVLAVLLPVVVIGFIVGIFFIIRSVHTKDLPPPQVQTVEADRPSRRRGDHRMRVDNRPPGTGGSVHPGAYAQKEAPWRMCRPCRAAAH